MIQAGGTCDGKDVATGRQKRDEIEKEDSTYRK
jgi:hypothetical protein